MRASFRIGFLCYMDNGGKEIKKGFAEANPNRNYKTIKKTKYAT